MSTAVAMKPPENPPTYHNVPLIILSYLDALAEESSIHQIPEIACASFTKLRMVVSKALSLTLGGDIPSNVLTYHVRRLEEKRVWIQRITQTAEHTREEAETNAVKRYSFYRITEAGRRALQNLPHFSFGQIKEKMQLLKQNAMGAIILAQGADSEYLPLVEEFTESLTQFLDPGQNVENSMLLVKDATHKLIGPSRSKSPVPVEAPRALIPPPPLPTESASGEFSSPSSPFSQDSLSGTKSDESRPPTNIPLDVIRGRIQSLKRDVIGSIIASGADRPVTLPSFDEFAQILEQLLDPTADAERVEDIIAHIIENIQIFIPSKPGERINQFFQVLLEELHQISLTKDPEGQLTFTEEVVTILETFLENLQENFASYLQSAEIQQSLPGMVDSLRNMLVSLRIPEGRPLKLSFLQRLRKPKEIGDVLAQVIEDMQHYMSPKSKEVEKTLVQEAFMGMIDALSLMPKPEGEDLTQFAETVRARKNQLMVKYFPALGIGIGL